jgi:hypothetical protein
MSKGWFDSFKELYTMDIFQGVVRSLGKGMERGFGEFFNNDFASLLILSRD